MGGDSDPEDRSTEQTARVEAALAAWLPQMHFPAEREVGLREKITKVCRTLAEANCDLAFVLGTAYRYALLHDIRDFQLNRTKREPAPLEELSSSVRTAAVGAAESVTRLRTALASLESLALQNPAAHGGLLRCLQSRKEFESWLSELARVLEEAAVEPRNSPEELIRWRTSALVELAEHLSEHGVSQVWRKLSLLISSFRSESVQVSLVGNPPRVEVRYSEAALVRAASLLKSEYEYACRKTADPSDSTPAPKTS